MTLLSMVYGYAIAGVIFALPFVATWAGRIDPNAAAGTPGFRIIILPGVVLLWPLLLARMMARDPHPPEEWTGHRRASR